MRKVVFFVGIWKWPSRFTELHYVSILYVILLIAFMLSINYTLGGWDACERSAEMYLICGVGSEILPKVLSQRLI